jgi:hypothetical protein
LANCIVLPMILIGASATAMVFRSGASAGVF